jgi:hypothetical protein
LNRATDSDAFLVGNGLRSCTSEVQVSPQFLVDGHPVILIDTPGFNDTVTEDSSVLKDISAFLAAVSVIRASHVDPADRHYRYENKVNLAGVIYFHRISDERWRRSDTRSFGWLRRICGERTLRNVVLATNMWGNVNPEVGATREQQLVAEFVKPALDAGAQLHRHHDTTESAHEIIRAILSNHRETLQVQQELVDEKREFDRTTVGEEITREVSEHIRGLEQEIVELQTELETVRGREKETRSQREAEIAELREEIKKLNNELRNMNSDYKKKKKKVVESFGFLFSPAGISISCIVLGALYAARYFLLHQQPEAVLGG